MKLLMYKQKDRKTDKRKVNINISSLAKVIK